MQNVVVLVPTRHEAGNVTVLAQALSDVLGPTGLDWGVVFVDDSDDETVDVLRGLAARDPHVGVVHRPAGARDGGLSGAVLAGVAATSSRWIVVMDGDLQHPPAVVPALLAPLVAGTADVSVASRYCPGGSPGGLSGPVRKFVSSSSRTLVRTAFPRVRGVTDPLGGFFAFERSVVSGVELRPEGFKILLELLARGRWDRVAEVPFAFASRLDGASKASVREGLRFLRHVARLSLAPVPAPVGVSPVASFTHQAA